MQPQGENALASAEGKMKLTGNNSTGKVSNKQASDQALGWVVRLRSDAVQETDTEAFAHWLTASDGNQQAWELSLQLWRVVDYFGSGKYS